MKNNLRHSDHFLLNDPVYKIKYIGVGFLSAFFTLKFYVYKVSLGLSQKLSPIFYNTVSIFLYFYRQNITFMEFAIFKVTCVNLIYFK